MSFPPLPNPFEQQLTTPVPHRRDHDLPQPTKRKEASRPWSEFNPPAALRRARILMIVLGIWTLLGLGLVVVGLTLAAENDTDLGVNSAEVTFTIVLALVQALLYLLLAGRVRDGVPSAVTTTRIIVILSLANVAWGLITGTSQIISTVLLGGLLIWLLVSLNSAESKYYIASMKRYS